MIVAQRKNIPELLDIVEKHKKMLVLGCGTCVTVCLAGGQREVSIIASALRMAAKLKDLAARSRGTDHRTPVRQRLPRTGRRSHQAETTPFFPSAAAPAFRPSPNVITDKPVYAGLDTAFIGILEERGVWTEKCAACGACVLHQYGGICPVTRCAKHMLNGPCSGSREDRCEVNPERPCAWQLIYKRLKEIGQLDRLKEIKPPKNWSPSQSGGCRTIIREDHRV